MVSHALLILSGKSLEQFSEILVLEMVVEVCAHVPHAPTVVYIRPYRGGCPSSVLQMTDRQQNSSMPVTDQANIRSVNHYMLLHKLQEPKPTFCVFTFNKCKSNRQQLFVSIISDCGQYGTSVFPSQKGAIYTQYWQAILKHLHTCTEAKKARCSILGPRVLLGISFTQYALP